MAQPKQPSQKQAPKTSRSAGGNVLFAIAVLAVVGGGIVFFIGTGSSQPASAPTSAPVADDGPADAAPASNTVPVEAQQPAVRTEPPKKRPPADALLPPLDLGRYTPARPPDQVRDAHVFCAQHPDVAQYIPCFCGCEAMGHQGNDDCFVKARDVEGRVTAWEPHGVSCQVCIDVANESRRMYSSGASVTQIRSAIETKYRPLARTMTPTPMPPSAVK